MGRDQYTVGWVCALPHEFTASKAMLDKIDDPIKDQDEHDKTNYCVGEIADHKVVMACLPAGQYGPDSAATVASHMLRTFTSIKFGLMVGVAGGIPSISHDIRLGDVVVSKPGDGHGGVINYDMTKLLPGGGYKKKSHLNKPPLELLNAVSTLMSTHDMDLPKIGHFMSEALEKHPVMQRRFSFPGRNKDILYKTECEHIMSVGQCSECPKPEPLVRPDRSPDSGPYVHYGLIGSGSKVVASIKDRDILVERDDILCFEMEAAGLMNTFPCLVVRGISDYADSYKRDEWQPYAALAAAAYAKELLQIIPRSGVAGIQDAKNVAGVQKPNYNLGLQLMGAPQIDERKFVGRYDEIEFLKTHLLQSSEYSEQRCIVVQGLGGMGKTQLAIRFATQYQRQFSSIIWLKANNETTLKQSLMGIAQRIQQLDKSSADQLDPKDETKMIQIASAWLSLEANSKWLVIFDNYDNPAIPGQSNETAYDIQKYFPYRSHGSILITTQSLRVTFGKRLSLDKFKSSKEGLQILMKHSERETIEQDPDAEKLVLRLDGLPLALATAGDYLRHAPIPCAKYLQDYEQSWTELSETSEELPDYEGRTLYNTWNMALERITTKLPEAANIIRFFGYFDNQKIWFELLRGSNPVDINIEWHKQIFQNEFKFYSVMRILQDYSLVKINHDSNTYSLHSCVHDWIRGHLNREFDVDLYQLALHCVTRLSLSPSEDEDNYWQTDILLEPHAIQLGLEAFQEHLEANTSERVLERFLILARMLNRRGRIHTAVQMSERVLKGYSRIQNPNISAVLVALELLGHCFDDQGKYKEAEAIYQRAIAAKEKVFGPEHLSTLVTVNNLGNLFQKQGKISEAETLCQRALAGCEKIYGPEHPSTLVTVNNLGNLFQKQGKISEAETLCQRALAGFEKVYGPEHPSTIETVNNLGLIFQEQGKLSEAETLLQRALAGFEKVYGPEHPSTLGRVYNLGLIFQQQNKLSEAETLYQRAIAGYEKVYGSEYPSILETAYNLGNIYEVQARFSDAGALYRKALTGWIKVFGVDHPLTFRAREALARLQ